MAGGRWLTPGDEAEKRRVIFLGDEMAKDIFGKDDPVGKTLLVNNSPFTVIGVMQHKTQMGVYGGPDQNHAVIPWTTFKALFGRDRLNVLVIQSKTPEDMAPALRRLNEILGAKYGYDPTDERALSTWNIVKTSKQGQNMIIGIQMFLGLIGALTLLIGGVGVANIMYAVVKERTREIGVKMALGAKARWITWPFVLEGLLYTLVGGVAGHDDRDAHRDRASASSRTGRTASSRSSGARRSRPSSPRRPPASSGRSASRPAYFPARRAASIDPAATLRYE